MKIVLNILVFIFGIYLILCGVTSCERECIAKSKIKSVGGCDKYGQCGVSLEDGRFTTWGLPSVGETICYSSKEFIKWKWLTF